MNKTFETIINGFIATKVGLGEHFLSKDLSLQLKQNLLLLFFENQLKNAGIGSNSNFTEDKLIRSDLIYWLDRKHNNAHENQFFDLMDRFVLYLNETCYAGITDYEFHYALYEKGSFYKRHLDQFKSNKNRVFSMIMYLNEDWVAADGGQLCIYHLGQSQTVDPTNGKCVFFKSSELEHEVLLNHKQRMSITGWLKTS